MYIYKKKYEVMTKLLSSIGFIQSQVDANQDQLRFVRESFAEYIFFIRMKKYLCICVAGS